MYGLVSVPAGISKYRKCSILKWYSLFREWRLFPPCEQERCKFFRRKVWVVERWSQLRVFITWTICYWFPRYLDQKASVIWVYMYLMHRTQVFSRRSCVKYAPEVLALDTFRCIYVCTILQRLYVCMSVHAYTHATCRYLWPQWQMCPTFLYTAKWVCLRKKNIVKKINKDKITFPSLWIEFMLFFSSWVYDSKK